MKQKDKISYLDKAFPKGSKYRGKALCLNAIANQEGRMEERKRIIKLIKRFPYGFEEDGKIMDKKELIKKIKRK